ncbi:MAG: universal stress protein [Myxococcales bacterium]|nr:universal stress protein [Myxococcales bacterium]MCB9580626.1 universal stress protein [Polyangiaceae bacterium]
MSYRKILVPVDFSSSAKQALSYATFLAEGLGATLHALFVWEPPRVIRADVMLWSETQGTSLVDHAREVAESHMESMFDELGIDKQRRPPHTIETGDPPDAIVEAATSGGYDLIVMGTQSRKGFDRVLLGSVSEKVVRTAPCPVLTVRPSS